MNSSKLNTYDKSKDALAYIMQVHGADVLLGNELKSFFNDYAPHVETLRKNIIFTISSSGAADILKRNMAADDMGRENAFRQAVQRVIDTYGTERSLVESVVGEFTDVLGWRINVQMSVTEPHHVESQRAGTRHVQTKNVTRQDKDYRQSMPASLQVGQRNVEFGRYKWHVLDVQNGKALLLSEDIVKLRQYHVEKTDITWEKCFLRKYLNEEFIKTFSDVEQSSIAESDIKNMDNPWYGTEGGKNTTDRIFLLNIEEVIRYFGDSGKLQSGPGYGADIGDIYDKYNEERVAKYGENAKWWWLRSPGKDRDSAAYVVTDGSIKVEGTMVYRPCRREYHDEDGGVRPALWINM